MKTKLFKNASLTLSYPDKHGDKNLNIKRFDSPFYIGEKPCIAHITVKETLKNGGRVYSLELLEIEKLEGNLQETVKALPASSSFSLESIKKNFENVKKARSMKLDANGEPTKEAIEAFINSKRNKINPTEEPYHKVF